MEANFYGIGVFVYLFRLSKPPFKIAEINRSVGISLSRAAHIRIKVFSLKASVRPDI